MSEYQQIGVIGAGAWGTALAQTAAVAGRDVTLWAHEAEVAESINSGHVNALYLPDAPLSDRITATADLSDLSACKAVLAVAPAQHLRGVLRSFAPYASEALPILLCAKGIEQSTLKLMTEVLDEEIPSAIPAVLSGPSFAIDVAKGLPTAVTLATRYKSLGHALMEAIGTPRFRPYWSGDLIGAEVGGAVKNVLAIACGIVEGRQLGKSAHAATIARGFAEMTRLAVALGAERDTLAGLCGLGDLVLTCSSSQSRNMSCGMALGRGESLEDVLSGRRAVTEGVATAPAIVELAGKVGADMPICEAMNAILAGQLSVDDAMDRLLSRPFTAEGD
ncbi:NAD(P)H-dependent glycerol-3-phosphate dehydrogenase [Hyphobacterium sp. HN65]|uniref:Glycerol-3-phosphate dehydrogenase [NAD(P)+] n=1 Tax=Hyphobacterium lacteum TaxID=3116575 RepID=A0ABU7LRQ7_9PROT|nr:NAD(P)H-dependent glycerol-3-phosphate dehydrogenase [Hyphobacterium sp. HN65]MEE2526582.1 NAD(P)H-dependent glycerol-3-phosphate dehydrogenase [Hyphobacterium sp. HN65]